MHWCLLDRDVKLNTLFKMSGIDNVFYWNSVPESFFIEHERCALGLESQGMQQKKCGEVFYFYVGHQSALRYETVRTKNDTSNMNVHKTCQPSHKGNIQI